jgi:disulfide bond formation protein DsbB
MPSYLDTFNQLVSISVIVMQALCLVLVVTMLFVPNRNNPVRKLFKDSAFYIGFLVALGAVVTSLFYSNVIGFPVCELCYLQRIFLYPQFILFGMELYKRDRTIVDFSIVFALLGIITSIYHVYVEHGGTAGLPCALPGASEISCATRYVFEFSYVTIPVMALTASLLILLTMVNYKYVSRIR